MKPTACRGPISAALLFATALVCGACAEFADAAGPGNPKTSERAQPTSYLSLGNRMLAAREPELAMKAFLSSMSAEGISAEAVTGAGIAAQQQGLLKTARRYFEQASELAPNSVQVHNNLGVVLYRMNEYYLARNEFRSAFALSSGRSEIAERNLNRTEAMIAQDEIGRNDGEIQPNESALTEADAMAE